ncbi:MAG: response regulator transcription factor [Eubacteriales bacterium]|nr:response regulator transcription factor [Eubacteriales bacterium]
MIDGKYVVLAADDEVELLDSLELFLRRENIEMKKAVDGIEAMALFEKHQPDMVLLDVMMPGLDGFQVLEKIREKSKIPAIMMTARSEDYDKILGLSLGADDYIVKPYNPLEVVARVKAALRRCYDYVEQSATVKQSNIKVFDLELDLESMIIRKNGVEITLTKTEYKILELLMKAPGRIYTKQQIFDYAREDDFIADDSTIMVHISNLRNKLEDNPKNAKYIKTVKGLGYRFEKEA